MSFLKIFFSIFFLITSQSSWSMNKDKELDDNSVLKFNIGGYKFHTTYNTIKISNVEYLKKIFNTKFNINKDEDGYIFIDRCKKEGKFIDYFIRYNKLPERFDETIVNNAADFFIIDNISDYIDEMLYCNEIKSLGYSAGKCKECDYIPSYRKGCQINWHDEKEMLNHLKTIHKVKIVEVKWDKYSHKIYYRMPI